MLVQTPHETQPIPFPTPGKGGKKEQEEVDGEEQNNLEEVIWKLDKGYSEAAIGKIDIGDLYNVVGGDMYNEWAVATNWNGPKYLSKLIGPGCKLDIGTDSEVLDVGAGSGVIGKNLMQKGFTNITGIDASEVMLKKAMETGAYKTTHCMYIGMGEAAKADDKKCLNDLKSRFDLVTACGCFIEGHIPSSGFDDVHSFLKIGGHFVINFKECNWVDGAKEGFKEKLDQLIHDGKFKIVGKSSSYREEWRKTEIGDHNKPIGDKIKDFFFIMQKCE